MIAVLLETNRRKHYSSLKICKKRFDAGQYKVPDMIIKSGQKPHLIWRRKNPDKWAELKRRSYFKNRAYAQEKSKAYYWSNLKRARGTSRARALKKLGFSMEQYGSLIRNQRGKCAICKRRFKSTRDRHADHCHDTGLGRELLCTKCNNGLGHVEKQRGQWLSSALTYLRKHNAAWLTGFSTWTWNAELSGGSEPSTPAIG